MKSTILHLLLLIFFACQVNVYSQWSDNSKINNTLMSMLNMRKYDLVLPLETGEVIVVWYNYDTYEAYSQKLNANGKKLWASEGVRIGAVKSFPVYGHQIVSDGMGGAIIVRIDGERYRFNMIAQRIDSLGNIKWGVNGRQIRPYFNAFYPSYLFGHSGSKSIISDGSGGAIIAWAQYRDVFVQRINSNGDVVWQPKSIANFQEPYYLRYPEIISSGNDEAIVIWSDYRNLKTSYRNTNIYAQKIDFSGNIKWNVDNIPIGNILANKSDPQIISDGSQGAIIAWIDNGIFAQRINKEGTCQWTNDGIKLFNSSVNIDELSLLSDQFGGAFVVWVDRRNVKNNENWEFPNTDIFAQRINSSGISQWKENGVQICFAKGPQQNCILAENGSGGFIISWRDFRYLSNPADIYAQTVNSSGKLLWQTGGIKLGVDSYIEIKSPKSNDELVIGTKQKITWNTRNSSSHVNIELSTNSGSTWKIIKENELDDGEYSDWIVPNFPSTKCKIKISDFYWRGATAISEGLFTIYKPLNQITYPIGDEVFFAGSYPTIKWRIEAAYNNINIDLSTDGGSNWIQIRNGIKNDGKMSDWIVPNYSSTQCKFRITDVSGKTLAVSNGLFTITAPSIQINSPSNNTFAIIGYNFLIEWKSTALSKIVNVDLSTDGGSTWNRIRDSVKDDGSIRDWIVPNSPSTQCKIRITDISGSPSATSNGFFTISKPFIAITYPSEGSIIEAVGNYGIEWKSYNISISFINIDLSTDGGTSWIEIRNHAKNDGAIHDWIVPNYLSTQCKLRITDSTGNILGTNNGYFTISARRFVIFSPRGGEIWKAGSNQILQWTTINISGYVKIDLSTDGGSSWDVIRIQTVDDGKVRDWIVPNTPSTNCKIRITDTLGSPSSESKVFTISSSLSKSVNRLVSVQLPKEFALEQNFPNPFNPETRIRYQTPDLGTGSIFVQLTIYDIVGREVTTLVSEEQSPGYYEAAFNGRNLPSGVYIYRFTAGDFTSIKKMILTK